MPLDDALVSMLRAHKARQAAEKLAAGPAYDDGGWLLADELGAPCHPESLSTWFERRVSELGLPRIRLHDTRHTAASLMLASGFPVKVVSEPLGHASPTITLGIYAHPCLPLCVELVLVAGTDDLQTPTILGIGKLKVHDQP